MLSLFLRAFVVVSILAVAVVVGGQLRASREQLADSQAASGESARTSASPAPAATATPIAKRSPTISSVAPAATKVPTPIATPFTGVMSHVTGTVTMGGKPVRGAQIMVYPSNTLNQGQTPMPPEAAKATTDDHGVFDVLLPPGTYRVGAFRSYDPFIDPSDGFWPMTWYGDAYAIGLGQDLVVSRDVSSIDIAILRSVKVAGRVVGRDGVGVPTATVSLQRTVGNMPFAPGGGMTDALGRFSFSAVPMSWTLRVDAPGRTGITSTAMDIDLRGDRTDLVLTLDRGNIVSGTLRDAAGRPIANTNFGVTPTDTQVICGWCNGRSDDAGHFTISLPSTTVRFRNWAATSSDPDLFSAEYVISGDMTLDPVLQRR